MKDLNTDLIGPVHTLDTGEEFRWSDEDRLPLKLAPGQRVVVITDEGALRRGRRRWHPGAIGTVLHRHKHHDRGWMVQINEFEVLIFSDEMELAP